MLLATAKCLLLLLLLLLLLFVITFLQGMYSDVPEANRVYVYTGLFISPSGISELDCATTIFFY